MTGKWEHLKGKMERAPTERSSRVEEIIAKFRAVSPEELVAAYSAARRSKDDLQKSLSVVQETVDALQALIIERFEEREISSLRLANGTSVSHAVEPEPSIVDKEAFRQWCVAQGFEREMGLHPMRARAVVKALIIDNQPEPPGVTVWLRDKLRLVRK